MTTIGPEGHWHTLFKHPTRAEYLLSRLWGSTPEPSVLPSWDRITGALWINGELIEPNQGKQMDGRTWTPEDEERLLTLGCGNYEEDCEGFTLALRKVAALEQRVADAARERDEAQMALRERVDYIAGYEEEAVAAIADERAKAQRYREALEAIAKVQYDGTVEGLREQIRTEDWGDVLDTDRTKAAYELTLAALADAPEVQG